MILSAAHRPLNPPFRRAPGANVRRDEVGEGICRGVFGYLFAEKRYKTPATMSRISLYFLWQPTHAARAETACGLCHARRRKTSVAKLKVPKPSACRFRGNNLRPALSGCSKNKTMQPPAPGTRAVGCSFSAASENADFSRRVSRRTTPAWQKRRSKRCGLKARAEGTVCLQTRE